MARGRKTSIVINLSEEEREELLSWQRSTTMPSGLVKRGRVILLFSERIPLVEIAEKVDMRRDKIAKWGKRFREFGIDGLKDKAGRGRKPFFPPEVAVHLVKLACERPDKLGCSLSQWDCAELRRRLIQDGIVEEISISTVQKILAHHKLKPWRSHMWLSSKYPRDEEFYRRVKNIIDLYTRPLSSEEVVLCVDEKTSLQPRTRIHETKPARAGNQPTLVEHEYQRKGALQLFAAFNTRTGEVFGRTFDRKRQVEFIDFLESLEASLPKNKNVIHLILDNVPTHHGKKVQEWLKSHPRFRFHFTPVHCSWLNQVEQWFGILQRKRFRIADFASKKDLQAKIEQFIDEWNQHSHPFNWTSKSVAKVMADCPEKMAA